MKKMAGSQRMDKLNRIFWIGPAALFVLAVPHLMDAWAGAMESGDLWLTGRQLAVTFFAVLAALISGIGFVGLRGGKHIPLERVFAVSVLLFGVLYLYVFPPLSAPDEVRHYISAYQLSNRMMGLPATGEDGKVPIRAEDWFAEDSTGQYTPHMTENGELATNEEEADGGVVLGQVLTEETYRLIHEKGLRGREAVRASDTVLSNHLPVVTTPLAYLIPALGITLARFLGLNSLGLLYLGRLMNLLFFTGITYLAMRRLPFGKTVLFGVALLPISLHLAASFSYDVFLMAAIFYFSAVCLDLAYRAESVRWVDVLTLAAVMAAAGPCKMVYAVFMGLCLLIPVKKFGSWKRWLLSALCVIGAWVLAMLIVNGQTVASYATETENYISWAGEAGYSFGMLIHNPVKTLRLFYDTAVWQAQYYHLTMIGAYLGNVDVVLDVPYAVVLLFTAGLLLLAFRKPGESLTLTGGRRYWIWFLCLICTGALLFSMLLAWTPVSSKVITGVQGRYFLPFLPILLMTWKNNAIVLTKDSDRSILYLMCCANAYVLLRLSAIVSMRL